MAFLPTASVQGTFTENTSLQTTLIPAVIFGGPDGTYRAVQFGQKYIYSGAIGAQLDLVNLQTWYSERIAKTTLSVNEASLANTRKQVYQQIAAQYYNVLLMREAATLAQRTSLLTDSVYQSVAHKLEEGTVNKSALDVAELNKERAVRDLATAQYQERISINNLKVLLDLGLKDELNVDDGFLMDKEPTVPPQPFAPDPAAILAIRQVSLSQQELRAAHAAYLPTLSLQYNTSKQQNDNQYRPFQGGVPWYPANYWTLKASWTILGGGSRWLQVQKSRIAALQAEMQYDAALRQESINDENLRLNAERAKTALRQSRRMMELSLDNYRQITYRNEEGLSTSDDRLSALSDYINYRNQYLNSLSDYCVQLYSIKIRQQNF